MATVITKTIKPADGDYTSLTAWEAGEQRNLVTADEIAVAECYSMIDTNDCTIEGWTTDATRYIKIYTPVSERHDGKWDDNKYIMQSNSNLWCIKVVEEYVQLEGLQLFNNNPASGRLAGETISSYTRVSYCIIRGRTDSDGNYGFRVNGVGIDNINFFNCIAYDVAYEHGFWVANSAAGGVNYYNCTAYNCKQGFYTILGAAKVINCISYNCTTDFDGTFAAGSDYNFSKDDTAPGANSIHGDTDGKTPDFVDATNGDFHLQSTSDAINVGTDDPGSGLYTDDIDREMRTNWDIGADEWIAIAPPPPFPGVPKMNAGIDKEIYLYGSAYIFSDFTFTPASSSDDISSEYDFYWKIDEGNYIPIAYSNISSLKSAKHNRLGTFTYYLKVIDSDGNVVIDSLDLSVIARDLTDDETDTKKTIVGIENPSGFYIDIPVGFEQALNGDITILTDVDAINQKIQHVLVLTPGTEPMNRNRGAGIYKFVYRQLTATTAKECGETVKEVLDREVSEIRVRHVNVTISRAEKQLLVDVYYNIQNSSVEQKYGLVLRRM